MTDPEFAVAIDYNALTKAQLLVVAGEVADRVDGYPPEFQMAVESGALTKRQANVLVSLRKVKGDDFISRAALVTNINSGAVDLAGVVKDWILAHPTSTEADIRTAFPAFEDKTFKEVMRYLIASKQIRTGYQV